MEWRTSIRGEPRIVRSARQNRPDTRVSGRFSVAPLRTRGVSAAASVSASAFGRGVHRTPAPPYAVSRLSPIYIARLPSYSSASGLNIYLHKEVDTINKTVEQLKAEKAKNEQEIAQASRRNQRLDNRIRYLTDGERKKRNHRLITRGAAVECLAPVVKGMGETDFFDLMEKVFSLPEVKALLPAGEGGERS